MLGSPFVGSNCQVTPNDCCIAEDRTTKGLLLFDDIIACQRSVQIESEGARMSVATQRNGWEMRGVGENEVESPVSAYQWLT